MEGVKRHGLGSKDVRKKRGGLKIWTMKDF